MAHVAGIDSSTQSCKVVIRDAETGALIRSGSARHPDGTEVAPAAWWQALGEAIAAAGGLDGVDALSVAGQQHGMVALDQSGQVVRPALLWNDTRSAGAAEDLIVELGDGIRAVGAARWAEDTGSVPVASYTVTKLRWLAANEPANAERVAAVALPHDWLTWRIAGSPGLRGVTTDRSDVSGTGYWSPAEGEYRPDLLRLAMGRADIELPRVVAPGDVAGLGAEAFEGLVLGPGAGDNAGAALGLGMRPGDVAISIGTSGVVSAVSAAPTADATGMVSGFADATGFFLPLAATLNASRVLDAVVRILGVDHEGLTQLAMSAPMGADGLVLVPYLEGERTPNKPDSAGALHGLTLANSTPAHLARAAVEGMLCGLADGLDALTAIGVPVERVLLIGGGARSEAVRALAPAVFGKPVTVPPAGEYVADGAARQAAWVLSGADEPPAWEASDVQTYEAASVPAVREQYAEVRELTANRSR